MDNIEEVQAIPQVLVETLPVREIIVESIPQVLIEVVDKQKTLEQILALRQQIKETQSDSTNAESLIIRLSILEHSLYGA